MHPGCFIAERVFGSSTCSNIICSSTNFNINAFAKECPVSVHIQFELYYVTELTHVFSKSETVETQDSNGDTWNYTGIMARNASHLGFEVCSCSIEYLNGQCEHEGYHSFCCSYILTIFVTSNFFVQSVVQHALSVKLYIVGPRLHISMCMCRRDVFVNYSVTKTNGVCKSTGSILTVLYITFEIT